jgi:hypothetical protein
MTRAQLALSLVGYRGYTSAPLSFEDASYHAMWRPASGHAGGWRITRGLCPQEQLEGKTGRVVLFKTSEAAQRRADKMNLTA